ncbi:MAG TPA: hypothetical protein VGG07_09395 [Solirubrobacteraceae bacterium]|jgi:hypothetical protein
MTDHSDHHSPAREEQRRGASSAPAGAETPLLAAETTGLSEVERPFDPVIAEHSRSVSAPGFIPSGTARRHRRAARRAAADRERRRRRAVMDKRRAAKQADRDARRSASYLPQMGERRPDAGRQLRRLRVRPHHATTNTLAVAYPFLAEAGIGSAGALIGHDSWSGAAFCFDPWVLYERGVITNPNILLAGVIGRGKSSLAKSMATRGIALGRKVYVPGDPKGEWSPVTRAVGGAVIALGPGMPTRLNPLDEGQRPRVWVDEDGSRRPMTDEIWREMVMTRRRDLLLALTEQALGRELESVELTALFTALEATVAEQPQPLLPQVAERMLEPTGDVPGSTVAQLKQDGRGAAHALARVATGDLKGLFDGPSTTGFDTSLPMISLDMSRLLGNPKLLPFVMTCASAWMEGALSDPEGGQRYVIYDEAWRVMQFRALLERMQSHWKLSRHWGIANMLVVHRLSDLSAVGDADSASRNLALGLLADCSTRITYTQEYDQAVRTGAEIGLSSTEIDQLPGLNRGEGLWRIGERAFVVRHDLTAEELELYRTDTRMIAMAAGEADDAT